MSFATNQVIERGRKSLVKTETKIQAIPSYLADEPKDGPFIAPMQRGMAWRREKSKSSAAFPGSAPIEKCVVDRQVSRSNYNYR